jgi:hypothetical protein
MGSNSFSGSFAGTVKIPEGWKSKIVKSALQKILPNDTSENYAGWFTRLMTLYHHQNPYKCHH